MSVVPGRREGGRGRRRNLNRSLVGLFTALSLGGSPAEVGWCAGVNRNLLARPFTQEEDEARGRFVRGVGLSLDTDSERKETGSGNGRRLGIVVSAAGLAAGVGLAAYLKHRADDRYERYLTTADSDRAREAFDAAERYDRATLIGWGLAQVSAVALIYFLIREDERPLVPVRGEPVVRPYADGVRVGFRVFR